PMGRSIPLRSFSSIPPRAPERTTRATSAQEIKEQARDLFRLLLLHPVPCPVDQVRAAPGFAHLRHPLERAGKLLEAPVARARNEAGRYVDGTAGENLKLRKLPLAVRAAVPLQSTLKSGAGKLGRVDRELILGQPAAAGRDLGG